MVSIMKSKKGDVATIVFIVFVLILSGIAMFVGHMILNKIIPEVEEMYNDSYSEYGDSEIFQEAVSATNMFDKVFFGLFVGFLIAMIVTSFFTPTHPIMIGIFMMVVMILVIVTAVLSNVWVEMSTNDIFTDTLVAFPITDVIMNYMPWFIGTIGLVSMVILYLRLRSDSEGML